MPTNLCYIYYYYVNVIHIIYIRYTTVYIMRLSQQSPYEVTRKDVDKLGAMHTQCHQLIDYIYVVVSVTGVCAWFLAGLATQAR